MSPRIFSFRWATSLALSAGLCALALLTSCSIFGQDEPPEPRFQPGEYGGDALPGTEHLFNLRPSPDGERIALIRKRTPGKPSDPRYQLWITGRDGSNPRLIGANTLTADWSPDGKRLAVTVTTGLDSYVYTINLTTGEATQWTGKEDQVLSKSTVGLPIWFRDGKRMLVSVDTKAYQQPYERGIYTINTQTGTVGGPFVEVMQAAYLGNQDEYVVGHKYVREDDPRSGNYAKYTFATSEWHWITDFRGREALEDVGAPVPSPTSDQLIQSREIENADQLFLMNSEGKNARQITELGGDNPRWSYDGSYFIFRRDVHKGEGARYVPFKFDLSSMEAEPLFPAQPDSLPDFPPLSETPALVALSAQDEGPLPPDDPN